MSTSKLLGLQINLSCELEIRLYNNICKGLGNCHLSFSYTPGSGLKNMGYGVIALLNVKRSPPSD